MKGCISVVILAFHWMLTQLWGLRGGEMGKIKEIQSIK